VRSALSEGHVSTEVHSITIHHVDRDKETGEYHFPDPAVIARLRSLLAAKSGIPIATLLAEQEARLGRQQVQIESRANQVPGNAVALPAPDKKDQPTLPASRQVQRRQQLS
jgi:hypothetical protein